MPKNAESAIIIDTEAKKHCLIQTTVWIGGFYFIKNPRNLHVFSFLVVPNPNGGLFWAFLIVFILSGPAHAAVTGGDGLCALISEMKGVFQILRMLAFVGAGFIIAKYGWEAISTGKIGGKDLLDGLKNTGVAILVGFVLLFSIGLILGFLMDGRIVECADVLTQNW